MSTNVNQLAAMMTLKSSADIKPFVLSAELESPDRRSRMSAEQRGLPFVARRAK